MQNPQIRKNCGTCHSKTKSAKVMRILHSKWLLILFILAHMDSSYGQFGFPILDNVVGEAENTIDKLTGGFSNHNSHLTPSKHKEKGNDVLIHFGDEEVSTLPNVVTAVERLDLDNEDNPDPTPEIVFESGNSGEEKNSDEIPYSNVVSNVENRDKPKVEQPPFVDLTVNEDVSERPTVLSSTTSETLSSDGPSTPITKDSTDNIKTSYKPSSPSTSSFAATTTLKTESFRSTEPPITSVTTEQIDLVSVTTDKPIENYTTTSSPSSNEEHSSILLTQQNTASTGVGTTHVSPILTSPVNIKELTTEQSNNNSELSSTEFRIITSTVKNDSKEQKEFTTTSNVILETTTEFSTIKSLVDEPELALSRTNIKPTESVASSNSEQPEATTESTATYSRLIPSTESAVASANPGTSIESPSIKQSTTFDELTTFPSTMLSGHSSTNTLPKDTNSTSPSPIKLPSAVTTSNADKIEDIITTESILVKTTETIGTDGASTKVDTTDINTEKTTNVGIGLPTNQTSSKSTGSIESEDITSTRPVDNISESRTESSIQDIGTTVILTTLDSLPNNIVFDEDVVEKHHSTTIDPVSSTEVSTRGSTVFSNTELLSSKKPEDITTVKTGEEETNHTITKLSEQSTPAAEVGNHTALQIESSTQDSRTTILSTTLESLANNVAFDEDVVEKHHSTTTLKQSDPVSSTETIPKDTISISTTELIGSRKPEDITTVKTEEEETNHTITKSSDQSTPAAEVDDHTALQIESSTQDSRTIILSTTVESLPNNVAFDEDVVEKHHSTTTLKQSDSVSSTETIPKDTTLSSNADITSSKKPEDITTTVKIEEDETNHTITKSSEQSTPAAKIDNHTALQIESSTQDSRTIILSTTLEPLPNNVAFDEDVVEKHHSTTTLKQSDSVSATETIPKDTTLSSNTDITSKKPEDITTTVKIEVDENNHTITKSYKQSTPAAEVDNHTALQIESSTQDIRTIILSTTLEPLPNNVAFDEDVVEKHHSTTTLKQSDSVSATGTIPKDTTLSSNTDITSSKKPEDITTTVKIEEDESNHTITKSSEQSTPAAEVDNHSALQIESSTQDIRTIILSTTLEPLPNNVAFDEDVVEKHHSTTTLKQSDSVSSTETIPKDTTLSSNTDIISSKKPEDITTTVKIEEHETNHTITKSSEQSTPAAEVDNHTALQIESSTQDSRTIILSTTLEPLPNNVAFDEDVVEKHHSTTTLKQSDSVSATETIPKDTTLSSNTDITTSKQPEEITTTVKIEEDETNHTITKSYKQSTPAAEVDNHTALQIESSTQDIRTIILSTTLEPLPNNVAFDEDVVEKHHSTTTLKQSDSVSATETIPKDTTLSSNTDITTSKKPEDITTTVKIEEDESNHTITKSSEQSTPAAKVDNHTALQIESSTQDIRTIILSTTLEPLPNNVAFDEDVVEKHHSTTTLKQSDSVSATETIPKDTTLSSNTDITSSKKPEDITTTLKIEEDESNHTITKSSEQSTPAAEVDNHTALQIESSTQDIRTIILSTTLEPLPNNVAFDEDVVEKHHSTTTLKQSDSVSATETTPKDTTLSSNTDITNSKKPEDITTTLKIEEDESNHTITKSFEQSTPAAEVDNHTALQIESSTQDIRTIILSTTLEPLPNNVAFDEDVVEKHHSTTTLKQSDSVSATETIPKGTTLSSNTDITSSKKPEDITTNVKIEEDESNHTITKSSDQSTPAAEVDDHTALQIESSTQDSKTIILSTTVESLPNNVAFDEDVVEKHHSTTTLKQSDSVSSTETIPKGTTLSSNTDITSKKPEDITTTVKIEVDENNRTITKSYKQSTPAAEVDNHTALQIESSTQDIRTIILSTTLEPLPNNVAFDEDVVEKHHSTTTLKQSHPETPRTFTKLSSNTEVTSSKKPEDITTVKTEVAENYTSEKASNQSTPSAGLDDNNDSQISTQNIGTIIQSTTLEALPDNISFDEDVIEVHSSSVEDKSSTPSILQSSGFSGTQLPLTTLHDSLQKFSSTIDTDTNTKPSVIEIATHEASNSVQPNKIEVPSITKDLSEPVTFKTTVESTAGLTAASNQFHKFTTSVTEKLTISHPSSTKKNFGGTVIMSSTEESTNASTVTSNFSETTAMFATEESTLPHPSTTSDLGELVTFKSTAQSITAPTSNSENDKAASTGEPSTRHDSITVSKVISSTETTSMKVTEPLVSVRTSIIHEYAQRSTSEFSKDPSSRFSTTTEHNQFSSHEVISGTSLNTSTEATYLSTIFPTQFTTKSENSKQNSSKESEIISDHETNLDEPNTGKENGSSKEEVSSNKEIPYSNHHTDEEVPQIAVVTEINSEKNGLPPREINSGKESLNFSEKPDENSIQNKEVPYSNHEDNGSVLQRPFVTDRPDKENPQPSMDELGSNSEKPKTTSGYINKEKDSSPKTDNEDKSKVTIPAEIGVDTSTESHLLLNYTKGPLELGNQIKPSSVENKVVNTNVSKGDSLQNLSNNSQKDPNSDELEIPYTNEVSKDDGDDTIDIPYENKVENIDATTSLSPTERQATEETSTLTSSSTLNKTTTARLTQGTSTFRGIGFTETTTEYLSTQEILSNGSTHKLSTPEKTITEASSIINNQNNPIETSTTGASEEATMTVLHTSEKSSSPSSTHITTFQNPSTISTNNFTTIISSNGSESIVSHTEGATDIGTTEVPNFSKESTLFVDPYDMSSTTIIVLTSEKLNIFSELTTEPTNIENVIEIVSTTRTTSTLPHSITTYSTENSISSASIKKPIISSTPALSTADFTSTIKTDEEFILNNGTEMTTILNISNVQNKTSNTQVPTNSSISNGDAKSCATTAVTTGLKYGAIGGSAGAMGAVFSQIVKIIADMMKGKDNGNKKSEDKKDSKDKEDGKDNTDDVEGGQSDGGKRNSEDNSSNGSKQSDLMQELNKKLDKNADEVVEQIDEEINAVEDQVVGTVKDRLTETSNQILGDIKMHMMQGNGNILTNVKSMFADGENNILTDIKKRLIETKSKIFTDVKSTIKNAIDENEDLLQLKEFESEFFKTDETIDIKDNNILHKGLSKSVDNINERIKTQFYQTEQAISYDIEGHMNKTENDILQEIKTKLPQYSAIISAININMANSKNAMLKDVKGKLLQTEILLQEGIRINMNHVLFTSRQALERRTSWPIVRNDYLGQTCTLEIINEKERLLLKKKSQGVSEKLQEKKLNTIEIVNEKLKKGKTDVADVVIKQQGFNILKHFRKNQQPLETISSNVGDNLSGVSDPVKNYRKLSTKSF